MAFVRRKVSRGRAAFYLVENRREAGKVRQRVLAYLGQRDTVASALAFWQEYAADREHTAERFANEAAELLVSARVDHIIARVQDREPRGDFLRLRSTICSRIAATKRKQAAQARARVETLTRFLNKRT